MEGAPSEGQATGSQIHPQLRQRMLNRAATFAEGAHPSTPALSRRRSSLISDLSDTRYSFRSSTDNLRDNNAMDKQEPHDGPTFWTSLPVAIALVPPIVGLTVQDGAAIATDMVILGLAAWFLNCCVRVPWDWYHEAQQRRYESIEPSEAPYDSTILEEDEDSTVGHDELSEDKPPRPTSSDSTKTSPTSTDAQKDAREALNREEMWAFALCFVGPLLGALLLHTIRGQLTRAEGIVSDFNLGVFVLGSEIRPVRRLVQMRSERIWHLQRIVRSAPPDQYKSADTQQLGQRLADLEARLEEPSNNSDVDISKLSAQVQHSTQLQLDALNRAVRRYEKRAVTQGMQYEARFQELDAQLKDALALAAVAARSGQRPGLIATSINWLASMVNYILQTSWNVVTYPLRTAVFVVAMVESWFLGDKRQARRRARAQLNGHSSLSTPRMQSKPAR